jgi:hypothetical protein
VLDILAKYFFCKFGIYSVKVVAAAAQMNRGASLVRGLNSFKNPVSTHAPVFRIFLRFSEFTMSTFRVISG